MKRELTILLSLIIAITCALSALPLYGYAPGSVSAAAEEIVDSNEPGSEADMTELEYVRFTARGNDPYGTFSFRLNGEQTVIDPDAVVWAAIRYRTVSQFDSTGVEYTGQLYIKPELEPAIPIKYTFSGEWETYVIDLTGVSDRTSLDSVWDSVFYTNYDIIRFDPLEPDRDPEDTVTNPEYGKVVKGDSIDVAWIAFFENEWDARTYTGRENTPAAVLDPVSFSQIRDPNNVNVSILSEMTVLPTVAPPTEVPTEAPATEAATPTDGSAQATEAATGRPDPTNSVSSATPGDANKSGGGLHPAVIAAIISALILCAAVVAVVIVRKKK